MQIPHHNQHDVATNFKILPHRKQLFTVTIFKYKLPHHKQMNAATKKNVENQIPHHIKLICGYNNFLSQSQHL